MERQNLPKKWLSKLENIDISIIGKEEFEK